MSNRRAQDERIEGTPDGSNAITEIVDIPDTPIIGTATAGILNASVAFTPASTGGTVSTYTATSSPGAITGTSATSPITVSGLNSGTSYTFTVRGANSTGTSPASSASNSVTIADFENGYDSLATVTLSSSTSSVTFAGIPSGYKHLQVRAICLNTGQDTLYMSYNGDTNGANYRDHQVGGNGTGSAFAYSNAGTSSGAGIGLTSQTAGAGNIIDILDYTNTSKNKTARSLWGVDRNGAGSVGLFSSLWMNTSVVNSITFSVGTYPFQQYSEFSLYGVK